MYVLGLPRWFSGITNPSVHAGDLGLILSRQHGVGEMVRQGGGESAGREYWLGLRKMTWSREQDKDISRK